MRPASHWLLAGMRVAVIGKGNIGGTLGSQFADWLQLSGKFPYGMQRSVRLLNGKI